MTTAPYRQLTAAILLRAVRDSRTRDATLRSNAEEFMRSPRARELAEALGLERWAEIAAAPMREKQ